MLWITILREAPLILFTFDPDSESIYYIEMIRFDLVENLNKYSVSGTTKPSDDYMLDIITCDNATSGQPVIYFNMSDQTEIIKKGNCIVANAKNYEFLKIRDLILYASYGVMDGRKEVS